MRSSAFFLLLTIGCRPEGPKPADTAEPEPIPPASCEKHVWYDDADGDGYGDAGAGDGST